MNLLYENNITVRHNPGKIFLHVMQHAFHRVIKRIFPFIFFAGGPNVSAQTLVNDKSFFTDEKPVEITLVSDFKKLIAGKLKKNFDKNFQPATMTCLFPDSTSVTGEVEIRPRGDFRREECHFPPLMINFKTPGAGPLKKLGRLKLVLPCGNSPYDEQLILKEYLVYKMYNLITDKSFRVRLVKMDCRDVRGRLRLGSSYAFFIEDVDDMARRNGCQEMDSIKLFLEETNRRQVTLMTLFQYMIGNTDWAVSVRHNIKLIMSKSDSCMVPYVVPYDFDCNGIVDANYSVPTPELGISNVRQRLYMGFMRSFEELRTTMSFFREQRGKIDSLITDCTPLSKANKRSMLNYIDDFYRETDQDNEIIDLFIKGARKQ